MRNSVQITVVGNLTGDPELRYAANGTAICRFSVAFNPRVRDGDQWKDGDPSYYACTAFGQLAEHIAESCPKGTRVIVAGEWRQRHWTDDKGEKRATWQLVVDEVGPSLAWATATLKRMSRGARDEVPPDDEWTTAGRERPEPAPAY
jgi:single-strand DNA-binding protein